MIFLTYWFVAFAGIVLPLYWFTPHPTARRWVLLVSCAVFHTHFAGPAGVLPIVLLGVLTYLAGLSRNRIACLAAIAASVLALVFYKYTKFICAELLGAISPELKTAGLSYADALVPALPPLAVSFFVFEFVHYLVEVHRGNPTIRSFSDFTLFSIFWPSIVAGPVKRYGDFLPALEQGLHGASQQDVALGALRIAIGMTKKFVADNLTSYIGCWGVSFTDPNFTPLWRWHMLLCISLRILLDFSGYSDMAIGFARMLGIRLPENFNWPYLACSLQGFWRRWHISLSTWIRDYIYITLGGNRVGVFRKTANGLLAFAICGLWHGAGWNFLIWGLMHGVGLAIATNYRQVPLMGPALGVVFERLRILSWTVTMLFVSASWLFFFYPVNTAWAMCKALVPQQNEQILLWSAGVVGVNCLVAIVEYLGRMVPQLATNTRATTPAGS